MSKFSKRIEYKYIVAIIYATVLFLDRLDLSIVNITLPTLAQYFNIPITQTEWISNAFLIALAIIIPVSSWVGEKFGIKRIFILATTMFGFASLLCAFSPNFTSMIVLRFIQGIGGGMLIPVGMILMYRLFEPSEYASITSFTFLPSLIAPAAAPALGGLITHLFGWQWVFMFVFPICLLAIISSLFILKEYKATEPKPLDWGGFILSSLALIAILQTLTIISKHGFNYISVIALVVALSLVLIFIRYEKSIQHPLIDFNFFKNKIFAQANVIQLVFQVCHFGAIFLVSMYLQVGVGMSAMIAGLIMGMQALGAMCTSRLSVQLFNRFGPSMPIAIGLIGVAVMTSCILLIKNPQLIVLGLIILFIRGIFSGFCGVPIQTLSIIDFDKKDIGIASAIFNASRQVSISLGVAVSSLLISFGFAINGIETGTAIINALAFDVFHYAFFAISIIALIGALLASRINNQAVISKITNRIQ